MADSLEPAQRLVAWRTWSAELERRGPGPGEHSQVPAGAQALHRELSARAQSLRLLAHSPYSGLSLGAVLLSETGELHEGVNVENASYGLTICAERSAVFGAVARAERHFLLCFLQGQGEAPIAPCGACRQVLAEFSPRVWVLSQGATGRILAARLDGLLPGAMGQADLPPPPRG